MKSLFYRSNTFIVVFGLVVFINIGLSTSDNGTPEKETEAPKVPKPDVYSLHITSDIKYRYANTLITSRVANPANVSQEVNFHIALPDSAFISRFVMIINEKEYEAYVKEKEVAKAEYTQAVQQGQGAAHISARDSNEFMVSVNIEPQSKVTFNLTYEQFLERALSSYKHEININPGQIVKDFSVKVNIEDVSPIINLKVPELRSSNEIKEEESDNSLARIEKITPEKFVVTWAPTMEEQKELNKEGLKGQFVVLYDIDRSKNPQQILIDDGYFVHFFAKDDLPPLKKHVVFILDISGSMHGRKLQQLKEAMEKILSDLNQEDYFSLVLFSDNAKSWAPNKNVSLDNLYNYNTPNSHSEEITNENIIQSNPENIKSAIEFIKKLDDLGGTNIIAALRMGIKLTKLGNAMLEKKNDKPEPMIIFLTDGEPNVEMSDPNEIRKAATDLNTLRSSIFSLGFGDGADIKFLRNLSLANSGFARNIYEAADATLQLKNFFKEVSSPLLSNATFKYIPGQVENDTTNINFNTFFSGSELVVAGKLVNDTLEGVIEATSPGGSQQFSFSEIEPIILDHKYPELLPTNRTYGHLERLWAYKSIKQLLDKNLVDEDKEAKDKALELALKYSFVTPLTSMVVVKPNETTAVDAEKSQSLPSYNVLQLNKIGGFPGAQVAAGYGGVLQSNRIGGFPGAPVASGFGGGLYALPAPMAPQGPPALLAAGAPPRPLPTYMPVQASQQVAFTTTFPLTTSTKSPSYNVEEALDEEGTTNQNYTEVVWLENQPKTPDGKAIIPPTNVSSSDIISLVPTPTLKETCSIKGGNETEYYCVHFIECILDEFLTDVNNYFPYKCQIKPNYLGVCCPKNVTVLP